MEKSEIKKSKAWEIILRIIKSIIVLVIIGFITYLLTLYGMEIYQKNSIRIHADMFSHHEYLDLTYGLLGILIYILINCMSFIMYNFIITKINKSMDIYDEKEVNKGKRLLLEKVLYIIYSIGINFGMLLFYFDFFGEYRFQNNYLDIINKLVVKVGFITFPIIFAIIYIVMKKKNINKKVLK